MISAENATFTYPGAPSPILTNVSFEVPERPLLAILGPNGCLLYTSRSWKTGVTAAMRPKVTARPESAPAVATSTGVRRRASRADELMCLVSQAPPTSATAGPG